MKSITMPETVQLDEETKHQLTEGVKETMAEKAIVTNKEKIFTASQMWNRHRKMSSASDRMRRWNRN